LLLTFVVLLYFAAAELGLAFAFVNASVSPIWAPTGIAIASVLLLGVRIWPAILLGAFFANLLPHVGVATATGIALGNTLEALSAALILRSLGFNKSFDRARDVTKFVLALLLGSMISATVGTLSLCLGHTAPWDTFGYLWLTWSLGDSTGGMLITPLLLTWATSSPEWLPRRRYLEATLLLSLLAFAAIMTFGVPFPGPVQFYPLVRLVVPFFIWAAFRLGRRGVTLGTILFSIIAVWGTAHNLGPFAGRAINESLLQLQVFVGSNAIMFMFLVCVVEERRLSEDVLRESKNRLAGNLAITQILAASPANSDATPRILQTIGETLGWVVGDAWTLDREANILRCLKVWHAASVNVSDFVADTYQRSFVSGVGLPGRVWQNSRPVWIPDVTNDDNFPRGPIARKEGLRSAFAFPILSGNEFLGVMEFFSREIREPDNELLAMFAGIGSQIGQFMKRKETEESLVKKQEALKLAHKVVRGGAWQWDLVANTCEWSDEHCELLGWDPEETPASSAEWFRSIHPDDLPGVLKDQESAIREKRDIDVEFRVSRADRQVRWFHRCGRGVYDPQGKPLSLVGITFDVTERKEAEERLRESQSQLTTMISSAMDAVISVDSDQRVIIFNAAAEKMFGYSASEALGQQIARFIPERFRTAHQQHIRSFGETGVTKRSMGALGKLFGTRAGGQEFPIEASISQMEVKGQKLYTVILRDITERQRAEEEREQLLKREHLARAEAENANRTKDEFLATLSHELRTPLNAIIGWSSMLRSGRLDQEHSHRALEIVERNAKIQAQLIEDILDVSAIVSGKLRLDSRLVALSQVVEAAVDSIRPAAESKNIELLTIFEPDAGPISGDPAKLQQIIWNLLSNAVKFTPAQGRVTVQLQSMDSHIQVVVKDTGQGISPEFLPQVFDRFRQADGTMTRRQRGLGLGLAIVRHLVELHGGSVKAESDGDGKGATFRVNLPLLVSNSKLSEFKPARKPAEIRSIDMQLSGLHVLVVDDEADSRGFITAMLLNCDVQVKSAGSAAEALKILEEWRADILISDIGMPDVDGYSLIKEVRKHDRHIQAVALTAHARVEDRRRAIEAGFQIHLSKPVEPTDLAHVVARLSGRMK